MGERIHGLMAATHTPMRPDGGVDLSLVEKQAELLAGCGVVGAFVCGTTGEGPSLTVDERLRLAERWAQVARGRLKVVVHVGHLCLRDAAAMAAHAARVRADGIAMLPPFYFRCSSVEQLAAWCEEVASAAPGLPLYYYHIPAMTGVSFPMRDFFAAARRIPSLVGAKFSHEDLEDLGMCLRLDGGRLDMLFGLDEMLLGALAVGARGAVGATYNFAAPLHRRIFEAFLAGDMTAAQAWQAKAAEMVAVLRKYDMVAAGKAAMKLVGLDCGPVRRPLATLTDRQLAAMRGELERIGFFDCCAGRAPA